MVGGTGLQYDTSDGMRGLMVDGFMSLDLDSALRRYLITKKAILYRPGVPYDIVFFIFLFS
jgi:uncharacterized protein YjhX (UPF0386 family)